MQCLKEFYFFTFRCICKNCRNTQFGQNIYGLELAKDEEDLAGYHGSMPRTKDADFYANLGIQIVKPRWKFEETLLLFLLLDRKVIDSSNATILQTEFNCIVTLKELSNHNLNKKSVKQIESKIMNMLTYVNIYDRNM